MEKKYIKVLYCKRVQICYKAINAPYFNNFKYNLFILLPLKCTLFYSIIVGFVRVYHKDSSKYIKDYLTNICPTLKMYKKAML